MTRIKKFLLLVCLLFSAQVFAFSIQDLIQFYDENGIDYVIMSHTENGVQTLYVIEVTPASYVEGVTIYNTIGEMIGGDPSGFGELLGDYIDQHDLSYEDSCESNPTCFGSTSGSIGGG